MALKNRVERLEKAVRAREGDTFVILVPADFTKDDGIIKVIVNGESRYIGTKEECDRWIDKNHGLVDKTIIVGGVG